MQATERIHAGGKPAQSQPKIPGRGRGQVSFRHLVLKSREQSEPEKQVGTQGKTEAPEQEVTEEVEGDLYKWASNICHLIQEDLDFRPEGPPRTSHGRRGDPMRRPSRSVSRMSAAPRLILPTAARLCGFPGRHHCGLVFKFLGPHH